VPKTGEVLGHQRFYYLELLKRARLIPGYSEAAESMLTGAGEAAKAGSLLFAQSGLTMPVLGVSPGAAYGNAKRWLPERFADTAVRLARTYGCSVAFFGSKAEAAVCESTCAQVLAQGVKSISFAGRTTLAEFINMAAACRLYLTNDSGPMHIASASGVPTIAVFGSTDSVATGPEGHSFAIVRHPVECSPCLLRECPIDHRCMTRVTVDDVVEATSRLVVL
jgi:heptosyltransferase-2